MARGLPEAVFDQRSAALWKLGAGQGEPEDVEAILELGQAE